MAKNILVINCDIRETRVCLIEDGIIAELHIERESQKGTLGNIYLGKVSRVLPGMQAAFIDIGLERAAFLHVEDLIRPADFDAYLAGHRGAAASNEDREVGATPEEAAALDDSTLGGGGSSGIVGDEVEGGPEAAGAEAAADEGGAFDPNGPEVEVDLVDADLLDVDVDEAEAVDLSSDERDAEVDLDTEGEGEGEGDDGADDDRDGADDDRDGDDDDDGDDDAFSASAEEVDEDDDALGAIASAVEAPESDDLFARAPVDLAAPIDDAAPIDVAEPVVELADEIVSGDEPAARAEPGEAGDVEADPGATATRSGGRRSRRGRVRRSGNTRDRAPIQTHDAAPRPAVSGETSDRGGRRGEGRGAGGRGGEEGRGRRPGDAAKVSGRSSRSGSGGGGRRDGRSGSRDRRSGQRQKSDPLRVSKTTPIRDVVREGQEVIVQVSKEPIGSKGARVTSHISLPGRYVVYLPTVDHIGISKRIGSDKERGRLREAIDAMKPPTGGLIVRTLAEGLTKKSLKADVGYLVRLWGEIAKGREGARAPAVLYSELDLILKTARDLFTDDIEKIVIDDRDEYLRLRKFVEMFMPDRVNAIELYQDEEPIFDAYGIEDEIGRALSRKVPLASGGHLIIDQAEALTAIDVNTGRYVGKGSQDLEDTILKTNLEAVEEIAYQLRFRNIGGLIILDLIDMERAGNREKVRRRLETVLAKDKAKTTLNRISDLGLIEMTRKRTRESLGRIMNEPCFYCDGTGHLQSKQTIAYEILRQINRERRTLAGYTVVVNAHPAVIDTLKNEERESVLYAERIYARRIDLVPRKEYHIEQFDLQGR